EAVEHVGAGALGARTGLEPQPPLPAAAVPAVGDAAGGHGVVPQPVPAASGVVRGGGGDGLGEAEGRRLRGPGADRDVRRERARELLAGVGGDRGRGHGRAHAQHDGGARRELARVGGGAREGSGCGAAEGGERGAVAARADLDRDGAEEGGGVGRAGGGGARDREGVVAFARARVGDRDRSDGARGRGAVAEGVERGAAELLRDADARRAGGARGAVARRPGGPRAAGHDGGEQHDESGRESGAPAGAGRGGAGAGHQGAWLPLTSTVTVALVPGAPETSRTSRHAVMLAPAARVPSIALLAVIAAPVSALPGQAPATVRSSTSPELLVPAATSTSGTSPRFSIVYG